MKKLKTVFCLLYFLLFLGSNAFSQTGTNTNTNPLTGLFTSDNTSSNSDLNRIAAELRVQMAIASPNYMVTAGDVYTLAYAAGANANIVTYVITVDSTYKIRVANLGVIDAAGRTYVQLKNQVEAVVSNNYPLSGVQFVMTRPAAFKVYVRGEVETAGERAAWALDRLSSVLSDRLTPMASLRDVTVRSAGGQERIYDLFRAKRLGDVTQDPYLRPGDTVTFNRIKRSVTLEGEVERPGVYQMLDNENLKELVEYYGSGFTPLADRSRLELVRYVNSISISGDKIFLDEQKVLDNFALQNYDVITVPEIAKLRPVIFVEGAVGGNMEEDDEIGAAPTVSTRLIVPFNKGEYYSALVRRNIFWFSAVSDTKNAYIIRGEEYIPINLNPMLYDVDFHSEVFIEENDTLIIPFRQYFVTVAGAVVTPGRYPYIPNRNWDYYIALAGGFVPGRNRRESVAITDISGKNMRKSDVITPESIITAETNAALYYFNQYAPVITTSLSIVTTALTVISFIIVNR
jgi:protein involved in polysaccharide export with SLBB domain